MRACVLLIVAAACGDNRDHLVTLSDLYPSQLEVEVPPADTGHYSVRLRGVPDGDECPTMDIDHIHVTAGGSPLAFADSHVTDVHAVGGPYDRFCDVYFGAGDGFAPVDDVVTVSDPTLSIRATFPFRTLLRRTAFHPTWFFERGETVSVYWSHPIDFAKITPLGPEVSLEPSGGVPINAAINDQGGITFVVPTDYPVGVKTATIDVHGDPDVAIECVNIGECVAWEARSFSVPAAVYQ